MSAEQLRAGMLQHGLPAAIVEVLVSFDVATGARSVGEGSVLRCGDRRAEVSPETGEGGLRGGGRGVEWGGFWDR